MCLPCMIYHNLVPLPADAPRSRYPERCSSERGGSEDRGDRGTRAGGEREAAYGCEVLNNRNWLRLLTSPSRSGERRNCRLSDAKERKTTTSKREMARQKRITPEQLKEHKRAAQQERRRKAKVLREQGVEAAEEPGASVVCFGDVFGRESRGELNMFFRACR